MNRQKKIGVFISHIFGDYQQYLCKGIISKATEYGYSVDIFTTNDGETSGEFGSGEDGILSIPNYQDLRGVILATDTYMDKNLTVRLLDTIRTSCSCPVVNIVKDEPSLLSVEIDNVTPIKELLKHLITTHNYKRICYVGSSCEEKYSKERLKVFKETMNHYKLPVTEENIYIADYSLTATRQAICHFMEKDGRLPDAIVCYNDSIALNVEYALHKAGYSVPEDVAVTGYDNIEYGINNNPPLTSVEFPVFEMGVLAMDKILNALSGTEQERSTILPTNPVIRGSCGCKNKNCRPDAKYNLQLIRKINKREKHIMNDMNMSSALLGITDIDEGMDTIEDFLYDIDNLKELYICLYSNWNSLSKRVRRVANYSSPEENDSNTILLKFGIKNGKRISECSFIKKSILPEYIYTDQSTAYIYSPLYFKDKAFGYVAVAYKDNQISYDFNFISWLMNVSNMLKRINDNNELRLLVDKLETLYLKDELTGLYNRHGFVRFSQKIIEDAIANRTMVMVASFDLDGLKIINDNFGHLEGDFSIKVISKAIQSSITGSEICSRVGGDEFMIIAEDYDETKAAKLLHEINSYLDNYNKLYPKKYKISVSSGCHIAIPNDNEDIDTFIKESDQKMYTNKNSKRKQIMNDRIE